jgi:hypothetical protein
VAYRRIAVYGSVEMADNLKIVIVVEGKPPGTTFV